MGKSMGTRTIQRHLCSDSHSGNHVANLTYNVIGKDPAHVVLYDCIKNTIHSHGGTHDCKYFKAREASCKHIYRCLRGKSTHKNCASHCCFGVSIRQPCMERNNGCIQRETGKDKVLGHPCISRENFIENHVTCLIVVKHHTCEKTQTTKDMHEKVSVTGSDRFRFFSVPNKEDRGKGHNLPENKESKVISGKNCPKGSPYVEVSRHMMAVFFNVEGIDGTEKTHNGENPGKDKA